MPTSADGLRLQTLDRGLDALELLGDGIPRTVLDIGGALALHRSVAYRIVLEKSFSIPTKGQVDPTTSQSGVRVKYNSLAKSLEKTLLTRTTASREQELSRGRKRMGELAQDVPDKSRRGQQALRALLQSEIARWTPIIKAADVKAD